MGSCTWSRKDLQNGVYEVRESSLVLPVLTQSDILRFLPRRGEIGENALIREFRQWLDSCLDS